MFFKDEDLTFTRVDENTLRKVLGYGEGLMNALIVFEKGQEKETPIPFHEHPHVQTTYVLKGSFKFAIQYPEGTKEQIVKQGDAIYFPSGLKHGCVPLEDDSRLLDSFNPVRADFLN